MVNVIGENDVQFKTIRTSGGAVADHSQPLKADQRNHAGAQLCEGPPKSEATVRGSASFVGHVDPLPPAVTPAERSEERLGNAMLKEALHNPRIPNPEKWSRARNLALARRAQLAKERRERVRMYAEEGELTTNEVADILGVVPTTVRTDLQVLRMKLKPAVVKPSTYQLEIHERRAKLQDMARLGITRSEAASRLGVSEATVRRDLMVMRMGNKWAGDDQ